MCIYVSMYVSFYVLGYVTPIRLRLLYCPGKWCTNEMARSNSTFLKVNQGDIGFGHLENIASWKHLDNFSTLSDRNQFFTLYLFFFTAYFPCECKASSLHAQVFGEDNFWWCGLVMRLFYLKDFVYEFRFASLCYETKSFWSLSELIINREWTKGPYFLKLVLSQ